MHVLVVVWQCFVVILSWSLSPNAMHVNPHLCQACARLGHLWAWTFEEVITSKCRPPKKGAFTKRKLVLSPSIMAEKSEWVRTWKIKCQSTATGPHAEYVNWWASELRCDGLHRVKADLVAGFFANFRSLCVHRSVLTQTCLRRWWQRHNQWCLHAWAWHFWTVLCRLVIDIFSAGRGVWACVMYIHSHMKKVPAPMTV